jgi:Uma2 family endonuclease
MRNNLYFRIIGQSKQELKVSFKILKVLELKEKKLTIKDYEKLPEGSPYQLIKGALIMSPAPSTEHQRSSKKIFLKLYEFIEKSNLGEVLYSPFDVYLDNENVYQPDIVVILKNSKAKIIEKGIEGTPDIVIEIISPSTAYYDLIEKKEVYEKYGVKEYWIIDPKSKTFEIYLNSESGFELFSKAKIKGLVKSQILNLELNVEEIFE